MTSGSPNIAPAAARIRPGAQQPSLQAAISTHCAVYSAKACCARPPGPRGTHCAACSNRPPVRRAPISGCAPTMRIALYLKHFPPSGAPLIGGTATAVHGLASGLVQNGADPIVVCEGEARSSAIAAGGYRIECFRNPGRYRSFGVARDLPRYLADRMHEQPGLCLLHGI